MKLASIILLISVTISYAALLSPRQQTAVSAGKAMAIIPTMHFVGYMIQTTPYGCYRTSNGWLQVSTNLRQWKSLTNFIPYAVTNQIKLIIQSPTNIVLK